MNRRQNALFKKGRLLIVIFVKYKTEVDAVLKLKTAVAEYTVYVLKAIGLKDDQSQDIKGYTIEKHDFKDAAKKGGLMISGLINVFANETGNIVLATDMKLVKSSFEIRDEDLLSLLHKILNAATVNKTALIDYGQTAAMLTEFTANVTGFEAKNTGPADAIGAKHSDTLELEVALESAELVLSGKIEKLMPPFANSNPAFFNEFESANKDTILGSHKKRIPSVEYGFVRFVLRNKNTMDHISEGMVKFVGEEEVYISTITGTELIESPLGLKTVKAIALEYEMVTVVITVTKIEQVIEILMEPLI